MIKWVRGISEPWSSHFHKAIQPQALEWSIYLTPKPIDSEATSYPDWPWSISVGHVLLARLSGTYYYKMALFRFSLGMYIFELVTILLTWKLRLVEASTLGELQSPSLLFSFSQFFFFEEKNVYLVFVLKEIIFRMPMKNPSSNVLKYSNRIIWHLGTVNSWSDPMTCSIPCNIESSQVASCTHSLVHGVN